MKKLMSIMLIAVMGVVMATLLLSCGTDGKAAANEYVELTNSTMSLPAQYGPLRMEKAKILGKNVVMTTETNDPELIQYLRNGSLNSSIKKEMKANAIAGMSSAAGDYEIQLIVEMAKGGYGMMYSYFFEGEVLNLVITPDELLNEFDR